MIPTDETWLIRDFMETYVKEDRPNSDQLEESEEYDTSGDDWEYGEYKKFLHDTEVYAQWLTERRKRPLSNGKILPSPEETAWMGREVCDLVEWFDRGEDDPFMELTKFYNPLISAVSFLEGHWLVEYCRYWAGCEMAKRWLQTLGRPIFPDRGILCNLVYHSRRDLDDVLEEILSVAKEGNGRAQNCIGELCEKGYRSPCHEVPGASCEANGRRCRNWTRHTKFIITANLEVAREWYRESAESGCVYGQCNYARLSYIQINGKRHFDEAWRWYRILADKGDGDARYMMSSVYLHGEGGVKKDVQLFTKWLKLAADVGEPRAVAVFKAAGNDVSPERLAVEMFVIQNLRYPAPKRVIFPHSIAEVRLSIDTSSFGQKSEKDSAHGKDWLLSNQPQGAVVPPASGRAVHQVPNLRSANPSFAAMLIKYVRDRFGNDAPSVYRAAHVSRKTYSAIIGNELRPVSKQTACAFALALHLPIDEATEFLKAAGFALSAFLLEDMIVMACIVSEIYDIDRVNGILSGHGAKIFPCDEVDE